MEGQRCIRVATKKSVETSWIGAGERLGSHFDYNDVIGLYARYYQPQGPQRCRICLAERLEGSFGISDISESDFLFCIRICSKFGALEIYQPHSSTNNIHGDINDFHSRSRVFSSRRLFSLSGMFLFIYSTLLQSIVPHCYSTACFQPR
jgi:hypothetical protein